MTGEKVKWAIDSFLPYKSPGMDGVYPKMLQVLDIDLMPILVTIYKEALILGHTPKSWQMVKVVFIPKPGKNDYTIPKSSDQSA